MPPVLPRWPISTALPGVMLGTGDIQPAEAAGMLGLVLFKHRGLFLELQGQLILADECVAAAELAGAIILAGEIVKRFTLRTLYARLEAPEGLFLPMPGDAGLYYYDWPNAAAELALALWQNAKGIRETVLPEVGVPGESGELLQTLALAEAVLHASGMRTELGEHLESGDATPTRLQQAARRQTALDLAMRAA